MPPQVLICLNLYLNVLCLAVQREHFLKLEEHVWEIEVSDYYCEAPIVDF